MFDVETLARLERLVDRNGNLFPQYADLCFSNIPSAVQYLLGVENTSPLSGLLDEAGVTPKGTEKVILFLIDGFGFRQWERYAEQEAFLRIFTSCGLVAPITAVFPSTTAAALTSICSGLTPQQHGLPEWMVYIEELDRPIFTIPFVYADKPAGHVSSALGSEILFRGTTIYERLAQYDIPSYTFGPAHHVGDPYSVVTKRGSSYVPCRNASDMLVNLRQLVRETKGPGYFYVYWDMIDSISHTYGPYSEQYLAELNGFFHLMKTEFLEWIGTPVAEGLSILMTADHGHINIDPSRTIFLNDVPLVMRNLRIGPNGKPILPWGSSRDCFLSIEPGRLEETYAFLRGMLMGRAEVLMIDEAMRLGLFGQGELHERFRARLGDLLILPRKDFTVWFEHSPGERKYGKKGMHGGLTPDEMLVPFACAPAKRLMKRTRQG